MDWFKKSVLEVHLGILETSKVDGFAIVAKN